MALGNSKETYHRHHVHHNRRLKALLSRVSALCIACNTLALLLLLTFNISLELEFKCISAIIIFSWLDHTGRLHPDVDGPLKSRTVRPPQMGSTDEMLLHSLFSLVPHTNSKNSMLECSDRCQYSRQNPESASRKRSSHCCSVRSFELWRVIMRMSRSLRGPMLAKLARFRVDLPSFPVGWRSGCSRIFV